MKPYEPKRLPLDCIDWTAHVNLIGPCGPCLAPSAAYRLSISLLIRGWSSQGSR